MHCIKYKKHLKYPSDGLMDKIKAKAKLSFSTLESSRSSQRRDTRLLIDLDCGNAQWNFLEASPFGSDSYFFRRL